MTEAVGFFVLTGRVVGVCKTSHEDHASVLAQTLNRNSNTGRRPAVDHDTAIFLDHGLCGCTCHIRFSLCITSNEFDFLAENTVALQVLFRERVQQTAVTHTVDVFNSEFLRAQFVEAFFGVWASLWYVETKLNRRTSWRVCVASVACRAQIRRKCQTCTSNGACLQHAAT